MKICLVNAPSTNELHGNDPWIIKETQGIYPPLGLLYIAASLKAKGYDVSVCDMQAGDTVLPEADVYGLTVMTFTLLDVLETVRHIKHQYPKAIVMLGGPHATIYPEETLKLFEADYVLVGEGEHLIHRLLGAKTTQRIWVGDRINDLSTLLQPARELTQIDRYYSTLADNQPSTTAITSRGCPFQCTYCDRPAMGKHFRTVPPWKVAEEAQDCQEKGIKEIFYYDDTFTVDKSRVYQICSEFEAKGVKIGWDIRARCDTIDFTLLKRMKQTGLKRIHLGVESGDPEMRVSIKKGLSDVQITNAFDACRDLGIKTLAYFMVGLPGETRRSLDKTYKLLKRIKPDYAQCTILTPFPATRLYVDWLKENKVDTWKAYSENPGKMFRPPVMIDRNTAEKRLKEFYRKFYLKPNFVLDRLKEINSWTKLKTYVKAGLSLLRMSL